MTTGPGDWYAQLLARAHNAEVRLAAVESSARLVIEGFSTTADAEVYEVPAGCIAALSAALGPTLEGDRGE